MSDQTSSSETNEQIEQEKPSYVKLAMRNMVRKRGTSLKHMLLSTMGVLGLLIGLSYLTR